MWCDAYEPLAVVVDVDRFVVRGVVGVWIVDEVVDASVS